jgi:hypothetical protein
VKQGSNILGEFYEGPPRCLVYPKLWLALGDSAKGNEVDDDGNVVTGDDNNNGNHDGDSDGNGNGTMGSVATGYDDKSIRANLEFDNNDATTTMAKAHQAGYYAHLILNWKNMWQRRIGRRQRQRQRQHIL